MANNPLSSKKFWNRIKDIKSNGEANRKEYPILKFNNKKFESDSEKADLFAQLLSSTFQDDENSGFDINFKSETNNEIYQFIHGVSRSKEKQKNESVNLKKLNCFIKNLKPTVSTGEDKISNIMLKNITNNFKEVLLHMYQVSITNNEIPSRWKKIVVKMIPKKSENKEDPRNFRPISLTSCLSRLCERFLLADINYHLKKNKILIKEQSGFRSNRQTKDNILSLCQRNITAFNKKKKNCVVFFHISKAFDKVWHQGLLKKLKDLKFKDYIVLWIANFLSQRFFFVKINNCESKLYEIHTGVPQGGVLSPALFSIFINDIGCDVKFKKNKVLYNLFADDLAASCASNKLSIIEQCFKKYLVHIETWLRKWRLNMNGNKCQYIIFSRSQKKDTVKLSLFNEDIPQYNFAKFLGVTFDKKMNFNKAVEEICRKCYDRLNILKILSNKSLKLSEKTLKSVYFSLFRSIIDYNSVIFPLLSETNKKN